MLPIKMDGDGMLPEDLDQQLRSAASSGGPPARLLYTVPTGHNPASFVMPEARRQALYEVSATGWAGQ